MTVVGEPSVTASPSTPAAAELVVSSGRVPSGSTSVTANAVRAVVSWFSASASVVFGRPDELSAHFARAVVIGFSVLWPAAVALTASAAQSTWFAASAPAAGASAPARASAATTPRIWTCFMWCLRSHRGQLWDGARRFPCARRSRGATRQGARSPERTPRSVPGLSSS